MTYDADGVNIDKNAKEGKWYTLCAQVSLDGTEQLQWVRFVAKATKEMYRLLQFQHALSLNNLCVGAGDLYVTVYGGRTRLVGILLGQGLNIDEAKRKLNGVTLESLVVAERVARAVKNNIGKGILRREDFPLLLHMDEILSEKKEVNIPWEAFTYTEAMREAQ